MVELEKVENRNRALASIVIEALSSGGCQNEAEALARAGSVEEFKSLCQGYSVETSEAGLTIEMITAIFNNWYDNGDEEQFVEEFTEKWGHPVTHKSIATFYWQFYGCVRDQWRQLYPELYERFAGRDISRIPWRLKYGYAAVENIAGWVPVPDYGASLRERKFSVRRNRKRITFVAKEGQTYEEARAQMVSANS